MSDIEKMQELISRYVEGEVTPQERIEVETAIRESRELKDYYLELQQLSKILDHHPQEECSPDVERNIRNSFDNTEFNIPRSKEVKNVSASWVKVGVLSMLFIGCLLTVQVYVKRGIQGRLKSASDDIGDQYSPGNTNILPITNVWLNKE